MSTATIRLGSCLEVLPTLPADSVHTVVTSPPYWGLRSYLENGDPAKAHEIGLERTPEEWVAKMVAVFREVRRVLRPDGTCWVNLGDCFYGPKNFSGDFATTDGVFDRRKTRLGILSGVRNTTKHPVLKEKDLVGQPWRAALALQADGWYLRSDIVWAKPNPMPESISDRPTRAHEYLFLLTKRARYFYDAEAIREPLTGPASENTPEDHARAFSRRRESAPAVRQGAAEPARTYATDAQGRHEGLGRTFPYEADPARGKNKRSVWTIPPAPFSEAHFATFPPALVEPCVKAGTSAHGCCSSCGAPWVREIAVEYERSKRHGANSAMCRAGAPRRDVGRPRLDRLTSTPGWSPSCRHAAPPVPCTVLDPFNGAGTTGVVALRLGRDYVGVELKREYAEMARARIHNDAPVLNRVETA